MIPSPVTRVNAGRGLPVQACIGNPTPVLRSWPGSDQTAFVTLRRKITLGCLLLAIVAAAALPYLVPLSGFIPDIEHAISERVHQPVSIGQLRLFVFPLPHVQARAITVGKGGLLEVDSVAIYPAVTTLLSGKRVIREVEVRGVRARADVVGAVRMLGNEAPGKGDTGKPAAEVAVDRITLRDVTLRFPAMALSGLDADIVLPEGIPESAEVQQDGGRLRLTARRQADQTWSLDLDAHDWKLPGTVPLHFDRIESHATVTATGLETKKIAGHLYGGQFSGPLALNWRNGLGLTGQLQLDALDLAPVVALFNRDVGLSGRLSANPRFSAQTRDPAALLEALRLESDFAIEKGVLHKVDLVAATKNPLDRKAAKGGQTQFDELKGHLVMEHRAYEFSDLSIASGLLKAQGEVRIEPDKRLSGLVRAELRGTAALVSIPFDVSGTTADPGIFPTKGAVAGAVAGTVLLPGLGTAVGMKAGELTERLFGKKKPDGRREAPPPR
jgi:hypothetical protein